MMIYWFWYCLYQSKSKKSGWKSTHVNNSYHLGLFCGTSYCVFEVFLIWGRGMSVSRLIWSAGLGAEAFRLLSKYYMCATITFGPAILGSELHLLQWHCTGQQASRPPPRGLVTTWCGSATCYHALYITAGNITKVIGIQNAIRGWSKEVWLFASNFNVDSKKSLGL